MPYDIDTMPVIIRVPAHAAIPEADIPAAEWSALKGRIADVEGIGLVDLPDVDTAGLDDETVLVYDEASGTWKPQTVVLGIRVSNGDGTEQFTDIDMVQFATGLTAVRSSQFPNIVSVFVNLAGSGTANSGARSDHVHAIRVDTPLPFPSSGSLSSGTRTLVSGNVTGLDPARTYVLKGTLDVQLRGDGTGAGRTRPRLTINENSVDIPEPPRSVAGVQPQYTVRHPGVQVTGVSSVAVSGSIAYVDGDPTWVGGGAVTISIESNR